MKLKPEKTSIKCCIKASQLFVKYKIKEMKQISDKVMRVILNERTNKCMKVVRKYYCLKKYERGKIGEYRAAKRFSDLSINR